MSEDIELKLLRENKELKERLNKKSLRGVFNQYANDTKIALEDKAWQNHIINII